jgi:hypothetical protein
VRQRDEKAQVQVFFFRTRIRFFAQPHLWA